jgi:hypothetical protein
MSISGPRKLQPARNPWGAVAILTGILSIVIKYVDLNSLAVENALWDAKEPNLYIYGMGRSFLRFLPFLPLLLGVVGLLLARGRSKKSSIVGIILAGACLAMIFGINKVHEARLESFRRTTGLLDQYSLDHNTYPRTLSDIPAITLDDRLLVTYLPGASRQENVSWEDNRVGRLAESPRLVCFLNDAVLTHGRYLAYLADGKTYIMAPDDFKVLHYVSQNVQEALANVVLYDEDSDVCRAALEKLTDQAALTQVAMEQIGTQPWELTRKKLAFSIDAVGKLTDQAALAKVAMGGMEQEVRAAAYDRLTDQSALAKVAMEDEDSNVRKDAVEKLTDQGVLAKMAADDQDSDVREAAQGRLEKLRANGSK